MFTCQDHLWLVLWLECEDNLVFFITKMLTYGKFQVEQMAPRGLPWLAYLSCAT
jgi:hypothetical protein